MFRFIYEAHDDRWCHQTDQNASVLVMPNVRLSTCTVHSKKRKKKQHGATQSFLDAHMYFRSHFQALKKGNKRTFLTAVVFMRFRQTSMTHTLNSSVIPPVLFVTFFLTLQHPFPPHWGWTLSYRNLVVFIVCVYRFILIQLHCGQLYRSPIHLAQTRHAFDALS